MPVVSGIKCAAEVVEAFLEMRDKRKYRYIMFRIRKGRSDSVNVGKKGARDQTFQQFMKDIPKDEPRFLLYDFSYTTEPSLEQRERILFIFWCPVNARVGDKATYAATKRTVLEQFQRINVISHVELTDPEEITEDKLLFKVTPMREKLNSLS